MIPARATTHARDVIGQAIPAPRVPTRPTLIRTLAHKPLQAETLDDLARHIHQLRGADGLRLGPVSAASYGGSDTFWGFSLHAIDPDTGTETWMAFAAVQSQRDDSLRDALLRTETRCEAA